MKRYHITGIFGEAENGKTTYMVSHLLTEATTLEHYDEFYCNLHVQHPRVKFITYEELRRLKCPTEKGTAKALVGLDQIHKYIDARRSNSQQNVDFSQVIIESRQHGFDLIYTTWMRSVVDKRLRPFTNLYVLAQRGYRGFEYDRIDKDAGVELPLVRMPWSKAQQVWNKFDTTELIEDETIPTQQSR